MSEIDGMLGHLMTKKEQHQLLVLWNDTAAEFPRELCLHELFEQQAERTPDAPAVLYQEQLLTYGELNARANGVAERLLQQGVGPDVLVGISAERRPELVIAVLGVLKAGGAYLPLDPDYPTERLLYMLEDSGAPVLLTQTHLSKRFAGTNARLLFLEDMTAAQEANVTSAVTATDLAYVIYTSGSTGRPKGTMIEHRSIVNFVWDMKSRLELGPDKRVLQAASFSFDASVMELFTALTTGALLCMADREDLLPGQPLVDLLRELRITNLLLPASALAQLPDTDLPDLTTLCNGGEACSAELAARLSKGRRFFNFYGPTEATIATSAERCDGSRKPPIGRPFSNVRYYVLDEQLRPVPVGEPGELHIGGSTLARGYLNRPELTAERFLPDPFVDEPGARMYKTGDLVRWLPEGTVEYLRRIDQQVKLRGLRIELGEIEQQLAEHPQIGEAVAIVREDLPGDPRLAAYVLPLPGEAVSGRELRDFLHDRLPSFMVPGAVVVLDRLPLTPNGKLDRQALPAPIWSREELSSKYVAPRDPVEAAVAAVMAVVLGVAELGVQDYFLELGGHSLLATQVISRVREQLLADVTVRDLLEGQTAEMLALAVKRQQAAGVDAPGKIVRQHLQQAPLSFAQQRLWFMQQMESRSAAYNTPYAVRLTGSLDAERLIAALQEVVARHESLRTVFVTEDGQPVQIVRAERNAAVTVQDLRGMDDREALARQMMADAAGEPFDLEKGPLLRCDLVRLEDTAWLLLLNLHHIVSDGWSMGVLLRELSALYAGQSLSELPIQVIDAAAWQRERMQGETLNNLLTFWKEQAAGAPSVLDLPTDQPRPAVQSGRGAAQFFTVPADLAARLKRLGQQEQATLFMTLLASYQALLHRYTRQDDLLVGSPSAGRTRAELEGLIGFFVNTLVYRADFSGEPSFRELLRQVRERAQAAYAHEELPFEKLVDELQIERSLSHHPLIQTMFTLESTAPVQSWQHESLQADYVQIDGKTSKFDLALRLIVTADGLSGEWEYSTDLFAAETIGRLTGHFLTLLQGIAAQPDEKVALLPLLTEAERLALLPNESAPALLAAPDGCIHQLIGRQAAATPDACALRYAGREMTYRELEVRANQLARHLHAVGVGPDVLVGLSVERSPEMIVSMLGILKAGGAYLPLDPDYPSDRLAFMLEDAQVQVLVTQSQLLDRLPHQGVRTVCLDRDRAVIAVESADPVPSNVTAGHLAYVIYTSGSTGKPKGVLLEHCGLCQLVAAVNERFDIRPGRRVLQFATFNFDASVYEIFTTLTGGATLVLADSDTLLPGENLQRLLRAEKVNTAMLPPAALAVTSADGLPDLQTVISGGEACTAELAARWAKGRRFLNAYGPTEGTVAATLADGVDGSQKPPIGRALPHVQTYVLDRHLQPVPAGVPGELHIGGAGLARGYLNREELTREKFIPHPFADGAASRLYKTGDLVRLLPDGQLDYLGRLDDQVKIRGFRIETGEIAAALLQHRAVREAVVVVMEAKTGEKRLVAYVVAEPELTLSDGELRAFLKESLPGYLVPSAFVLLERLPLTANGKVDRRALPVPDAALWTAEYVAPRDEVERLTAEIWQDVLGVENVGVRDDFFARGGHSLTATQVVSRLQRALQADVTVRDLFAGPTVEELAARIRGRAQQEAPPAAEIVARERVDGMAPLSFSQQRLWFLQQLKPDSAAYNIPFALHLRGALDLLMLERSLQELAGRHEALRTTFAELEGKPVQVIARQADLKLVVQEIPEAEVERLARDEAQTPFDLTAGPLLRATALRVNEQEHVLLLTMHHIISDGWSMGIFLRELTAVYRELEQGGVPQLAELPVQYADYAEWQLERLQGEKMEHLTGYWKQKLNGAPTVLELPADRPHPPVQSYAGAYCPLVLSKALTERLKAMCQAEGATLFAGLLAAYQAFLYRMTRQEDLLVGFPAAGRNRAETEGLIGFFVNTLVSRAVCAPEMTFRDLLAQVSEGVLEAYEQEEMPFEKLIEELQVPRSLSHNPLIQTMFLLEQEPVQSQWQLPNLEAEMRETDSAAAMFDLTLHLTDTGQGLAGGWQYSTDLFDAATMERMSGHLVTMLEALTADPGQKLAGLPLLTAEEEHRLLVTWNQQEHAPISRTCIHELFEFQVAQRPDETAVVYGADAYTYGELNERANRLAHKLRTLGVGAETLVGVCMSRSAELPAALLGILKAGGAYVPLDPDYPAERIALMMEDAGVSVLLTEQKLLSHLPEHGAQVLLYEDTADEPAETSSAVVAPDQLAYVIYTSGSTGRPKGVAVEHHSVHALIEWSRRQYAPDELAVVLAGTSICFDLSVWEFFVTLSLGGKLVIADNALALPNLPNKSEITLINTVPSAITELLRQKAIPKSVRVVNLCGEPLKRQIVDSLYALGTVEKVVNVYGPTEDTVYTTYSLTRAGQPVTIGRAIDRERLFVLDEQMRPVPIGVAGELYIGGAGLSRGYLHRAELTGERYLNNPFAHGERLYRTGDLVRWLASGELDYLGRLDHQVKIRGFRIEIGEVEETLLRHEAVLETAVIARDDHAGNKRLIAYAVLEKESSASALRAYMKASLPDYMVPSLFMLLEELPHTPSGKIDRKLLPVPDFSALQSEQGLEPRNETERALAALFAEVLGLERVGADDNFFESGGHSLLATQLISRIRDHLQIELPLRACFEAPTVAELAERLREAGAVRTDMIPSGERDGILPLSFTQQRLWFMHRLHPENPMYNMPTVLRMCGDLNLLALEAALGEIVRRHEALRTVFVQQGEEAVQVIGEPKPQRVTLLDLSRLPEPEREADAKRILHEETHRPFELSKGPLLRVILLRLSDEEHVMLLLVHHIISDGWSNGVLTRELTALYEQYTGGKEAALPALPVQYADYACWQREWLLGGEITDQLGYWQEQLSGELPVLALTTDRPRPAEFSYRGTCEPFQLSEELTAQLNRLSRQEGVTLFMTLLAAFNTLLHRYTGQDDIIVGSPIAGRSRAEIEQLIGFFVNMLPLRTDLSGDPTFRELLQRVKRVTLGAYAHQDVPFEQLVDEVKPERDLSRTPLFQACLILQNLPDQVWRLPGLTVEAQPVTSDTAKFDITFAMQEQNGRLHGVVEYNTDLFDAATIRRMTGHWSNLLESIAEEAGRPLYDLPWLSEAEKHDLLERWNDTRTPYPRDKTIQALFEEQAARTPDADAVLFAGDNMTYRELNEQANRVAHRLLALGVQPDEPIGISVSRSFDLLIGVLGIVKAGGAYVPLDPEYPNERLALMVEDAALRIILTQEHLLADLPDTQAVLLCLDRDREVWDNESCENPPCRTTSDHLAYIIYTSGSTGRPKGTCIPQHAVSRLVKNSNYVQFTAEDTIAQVSNSAFDAATFEFWGALLNGGRLVILPKELVLDVDLFAAAIQEHNVTSMFLTVALFNQMAAVRPDAFRTMRDLLAGGDALDPKWVKAVLEHGAPKRLLNGYGPTESTTFAAWHEIKAVPEGAVSIPIGQPLANTSLYVLDVQMQPVAIGVPGELYIGGDGLARGYLNRPDLTAERFVPHPFSAEPNARLYKTGDLVRRLADGNIEFIGRVDFQVKIRGFRIELGEIKETLLRHELVQDALVLAREDEPGEKRIIAYVTPSGEESGLAQVLRRDLKEQLPAYMVPAVFLVLKSLPLTPNGKIDRSALPKPEDMLPETHQVDTPRQAGLESDLRSVWQEVLGRQDVGLHDNFFDLGGHSLLLSKAHQKIQERIGRTFPLVTMFKHTTVAALTSFLQGDRPSAERKKAEHGTPRTESRSIAIIGMAGRFPDASDLARFWRNLADGVQSVQFFPEEQPAMALPGMVMAGALLPDPEYFDAEFFGMSEQEALLTDPQQRLLLECSQEALESAGYIPQRFDGKIALYAAGGENKYAQLLLQDPSLLQETENLIHFSTGNDTNFLTTKVSYRLNLKGPSFVVQTACTGSAVSIHLACQSLLAGESDMALAGGTNVKVPQKQGYLAFEGGPYSFTGENCRPFDADTEGAFVGFGTGVVLLKRLDDALRDGDPIHAVIRSTALNNDGAAKVGFTALGAEGIEQVIREAVDQAGIDPQTVTYIAAHGMGTPLGDAIEADALATVYGAGAEKTGWCALNSIKPNIGHTGVTAGVANVIHTVLAMQHKALPPLLGYRTPNPQIEVANSPFYFNTALTAWETEPGVPRRAGVNSFALGGTNAHLILEEAPALQSEPSQRAEHAVVLSARTPEALEIMANNLADHLEQHPGLTLADVAYTLQTGRAVYAHSRVLLCRDVPDAIAQLRGQQQRTVSLEELDWSTHYANEKRLRVPLPTYPFEKKRYSVEPQTAKTTL
ncbi:amino acid adenylation domain-containing protein [Tumebacillus sp. BK434]|uniref:non-ribosomal peptide synthetase n=1 Tax=Tumebacillus sp. BK434 TaxID=2512169 RepID=UPI00104EE81B|nr:non-ribosomal peptide synthetase [Tumebacillus sp. BK434]TCP53368.1 amino acid adenylation domain-containing protein [Tumebacillus sp. BK434]